jgi:transcriptional regulator with XRE-family HTH domain
MDVTPVQEASDRQAILSLILKAIRRRRGLRSAEVARLMGMALRSYQRFESGAMGLDLDKIHRFADVVDTDGWAIVFAVEMGSVEFALYCADNKACSALLVAMRRFNAKSGRDIARLDPRSLFLVFSKTFNDISERAREYDAYLEQWMFDETLNGDPDDDQA